MLNSLARVYKNTSKRSKVSSSAISSTSWVRRLRVLRSLITSFIRTQCVIWRTALSSCQGMLLMLVARFKMANWSLKITFLLIFRVQALRKIRKIAKNSQQHESMSSNRTKFVTSNAWKSLCASAHRST